MGSGEDSGEGLGGFGAEPGQVQQVQQDTRVSSAGLRSTLEKDL